MEWMEVERVLLLPFPDDPGLPLRQLGFLSHNHCLQNSNRITMFTFIIILIVPSSTLEPLIPSIHFLFGFLSCLIVHLFFFLFVFNKSCTVITIQFGNIAIITKTSDSADFNYSCMFSIRSSPSESSPSENEAEGGIWTVPSSSCERKSLCLPRLGYIWINN